ncbi:hypothetical protein HN51_022463 [Arachis hypogaea]
MQDLELEVVELRRVNKELKMQKRSLTCRLSSLESQLSCLAKSLEPSDLLSDLQRRGLTRSKKQQSSGAEGVRGLGFCSDGRDEQRQRGASTATERRESLPEIVTTEGGLGVPEEGFLAKALQSQRHSHGV